MVSLRLSAAFWLTDSHGSMLVAPNVAAMQHRVMIDDDEAVIEFRNKVGTTAHVDRPHVPTGIAVRHALVTVDFEVDADADDFGDELRGDAIEQAHAQAIRANDVAREAVSRFRQWARTKHPWLAHPYTKPEQVEPAEVVVIATGRVLPLAPQIAQEHRGFGTIVGQEPINVVDMADIASGITMDEKPDVALALLADARYLMHWSPTKDPPRAVLVAGIACEVQVKSVLRAKATGSAATILDVLLDNPRAFPHSALALFDDVAEAVVGRSLRTDDRPLYKRVDLLFQLRNRIAHHGHDPAIAEAREAVSTAIDVFDWLGDL
jgi:hypothetical protein